MRKVFMTLLIFAFASGAAFAHGGKSHKLLGTVKEVRQNQLVVTATDGHTVTVLLARSTQYEKDAKAVTRDALKPGTRVAIQLTEDDKSAVKVRIGNAAPAAMPAQVVDPVCGMRIDPRTAAASSTYEGKTYWFCAKEEKEKFDKNPAAYVKK